DRLPPYDIAIKDMLGFSSQKLIDFDREISEALSSWGSVLKNPDRLRTQQTQRRRWLGFSSQKP
ncbi:hypothetical protein ACQX2E_05630, partial [Corynebacterium diphtheriae]